MATNYKASNADLETKFNPVTSTPATAKTYGSPSMTIDGEGSVLVPEVTLDAHGHITVVERTLTFKSGTTYKCSDIPCGDECSGEGDNGSGD